MAAQKTTKKSEWRISKPRGYVDLETCIAGDKFQVMVRRSKSGKFLSKVEQRNLSDDERIAEYGGYQYKNSLSPDNLRLLKWEISSCKGPFWQVLHDTELHIDDLPVVQIGGYSRPIIVVFRDGRFIKAAIRDNYLGGLMISCDIDSLRELKTTLKKYFSLEKIKQLKTGIDSYEHFQHLIGKLPKSYRASLRDLIK